MLSCRVHAELNHASAVTLIIRVKNRMTTLSYRCIGCERHKNDSEFLILNFGHVLCGSCQEEAVSRKVEELKKAIEARIRKLREGHRHFGNLNCPNCINRDNRISENEEVLALLKDGEKRD